MNLRLASQSALSRMSAAHALIGLALLLIGGCGHADTQVVTGSITLDGQPLAHGQIEFTPTGATRGPIAGATIENGRYQVPAVAQGLKTGGVYRVMISSMVGSGRFIRHPEAPGGKMEALKNVVPPRYNDQSELTITISAQPDENVHDFSLTSQSS